MTTRYTRSIDAIVVGMVALAVGGFLFLRWRF